MNENLQKNLMNIGFSKKESKLYLSLLKSGPIGASSIARNIGENRTTTYSILKEMIKKGYISEIEKNKIYTYTAISPNLLLNEIEKKYIDFKNITPILLSSMSEFGNNVEIQRLQGDEGLKELFIEFANSETEVKTFAGNRKYQEDKLLKYSDYYTKKRLEKGYKRIRIISKNNLNITEKELKISDKKFFRKTIIVDGLFDIKCDIDIFGPNKTSFLFFENEIPHIYIINNKKIYDCLNSIFNLIAQNYL